MAATAATGLSGVHGAINQAKPLRARRVKNNATTWRHVVADR